MPEQNILPPPNPESYHEKVNTIGALRETRRLEAERAGLGSLMRSVRYLDQVYEPNSSLTKVPDTALFGWSMGELRYDDLLAYEAIGVDPTDLLEVTGYGSGEDGELLSESKIENETLVTKRSSIGVSLTFSVQGHEPDFDHEQKPKAITEKIRARLLQSPAYKAIHEAAKQYDSVEVKPKTFETRDFDIEEDRIGSLAIIAQLGLIYSRAERSILDTGLTIGDILNNSVLLYGTEVETVDGKTVLSKSEHGVNKRLVLSEGKMASIHLGYDEDYFYAEQANQSQAESIPFVETIAAREMCDLLDSVGLTFSPKYQAEMVRVGESERFGAVYTQISREVAKWVNRPSRMQVASLFTRFNPDYHAKGLGYFENAGVIARSKQEYEMTEQELAEEEKYISDRLSKISLEG